MAVGLLDQPDDGAAVDGVAFDLEAGVLESAGSPSAGFLVFNGEDQYGWKRGVGLCWRAVRFRAASSRVLPKQLWRSLANTMSLGGALPAKYRQRKTLAVEVGPEHAALVGQPATVGTYADRVIRVYPCPHCSVGYLTHTFLHELAHAWIDIYHPEFPIGGPEEEFADLFASVGFASLPGRLGGFCSGYPIELPLDARRSAGFQKFFQLFVKQCPPTMKHPEAITACRTAAAGLGLRVTSQGIG